MDDCFADHPTEARNPSRQPIGDSSAMQWKIGGPGASSHVLSSHPCRTERRSSRADRRLPLGSRPLHTCLPSEGGRSGYSRMRRLIRLKMVRTELAAAPENTTVA